MHELAEKKSVENQTSNIIYGAVEGQEARILAEKARAIMLEDNVLMHIAMDDSRALQLQELVHFFASDVQTIFFPAWDCLPYDRVSPNHEIVASRLSALTQLLGWEQEKKRYPRLLITTVNAVLQRVSPKSAFLSASFSAQKGSRIDIEQLQTFLTQNGYSRTQTVREPGEFAIRGGIIDLFPSGTEKPCRMDLFGDEVESLRYFDPATQRTLDKADQIHLTPASEFFLDEESIQRFRSQYREAFGVVQKNDPLYEAVSEGRRYNGMDHWLPLFYEKMDTLFDYVPDAHVTQDQNIPQAAHERLTQIEDFYQARKTLEASSLKKKQEKSKDVSLTGSVYHPLPAKTLYLGEGEWREFTENSERFSPFDDPGESPDAQKKAKKSRDFADIRALPDGDVFKELAQYISNLREDNRKIAIATYSEGARDRFKGLLETAGFQNLVFCNTYESIKKLKAGQLGLCLLGLERGFVADDLAILTEQDILGDRLARKAAKRRKADNFLTEISALEAGDLVVHVDHGIGRFEGLETLEAAGAFHDCLKLVYQGGDKLFVPVENMDVLSRFGSEEAGAALDKLGGAGWQARKAKAKKDLMKIADHLLEIAAARQLKEGEKIEVANDVYNKFAARFPYHETDDQLRAIHDAIEDLNSGRPMDRLICGDVGFGKTEVALRVAYVAAMDGYQVAIVAPTTLLVRQHYQTFKKRFEGLGLRIEQLSRLVSSKDVKATHEGLKDGSVNIVVGTHALFSQSVKFSHLGLLIVDEEQRFGVKQKERLKELKANVHVLTLTATPIPRTLQMSLTGVKEMSIIATPPVDRLAIRTFVLPYDPMVIREALLREHYRGGQSFYVCPRIKDLDEVEDALKDLVPELKIVKAHGQMGAQDLEDRMNAFYDGQYNVLLATNIIESGLDIPTANTMIVHRADMFGLAQLYQIRGRIGRSKVRAYAYMTHDPAKKLTEQAQKRLEVIETLDTLGAGFQLASHDMDIRGAGNLLGEAQSGHIKEIGVELYQQMLEEAVAAAKEGVGMGDAEIPDHWSPQINLGTSVLIPETYVEDLSVRMSLYRRLSQLDNDQEIEDFAAEMIDRFGPIPAEFENLLDTVKIKRLCKTAGIDKVEAGPKGVVLSFYQNTPPKVEALMGWLTEKKGTVKLRPDQKLVVPRQWEKAEQRVKGATRIVQELSLL